MKLVKPIEYNNEDITETNSDDIIVDLFDIASKGESIPLVEQPKKQSKRRKKKNDDYDTEQVITSDGKRELRDHETNEPYINKYKETNAILKQAIAQVDIGLAEMNADINAIRASKTMRKKYDYLAAINGTMGNFISNKISAARELNNTITKANELELKRMREIAMSNEQNDDKAIMDMYQAFVNTPVGTPGYSPLGPTSLDMTVAGGINGSNIGNDSGYDDYLSNMTPTQHMMMLESNPDVKQVVVLDKATGRMAFDVVNMKTGQSVPNVEKRDSMFLADLYIDERNQIARDSNLGISYPLITINNKALDEY